MTDQTSLAPRPRVLSGMRPTGRLHLGNYMGALHNWVKLQNQYDCYFFIADFHALTTDYADVSRLQENTLEVAMDFLSAGLDPMRSTLFVQSHIPQHAELHLLFSMFTPLSWLERVPTYKDQQEQLKEKDLATYGFLGYPLLQSADILLYQPDFVPVGQDQVAHVELTREVSRRFNTLYPLAKETLAHVRGDSLSVSQMETLIASGKQIEAAQTYTFSVAPQLKDYGKVHVFTDPQVLLTPSPKLPGIDGRKMSKSYGNTIMLTDQPPVIHTKMARMSNGDQRFVQSEPGNPDICPVGDLHKLFSSADLNLEVDEKCRTAKFGCLLCKQLAAESIVMHLRPIQAKRFELETNQQAIIEILADGAARAESRASSTMEEVRRAMGMPRKIAPKKVETALHRMFEAMGNPTIHNLVAQKDWWIDDPKIRAQKLQDYWLREIVPSEILLKRNSERVFITPSNKRVYVSTAREDELGYWRFYAKPKSYEVLDLLCWDQSFMLYEFVIPQKVYIDRWSYLKKQSKNADIGFQIRRSDSSFFFEIDGLDPVDVSEYQSKHELLR